MRDFNFELIYRASRDGFDASSFHAKCDDQSGTLTIIKTTNGYIFCAYASVAWDSTSGYKADPNAFILSLMNVNFPSLFIPAKINDNSSICCKAGSGPTFGAGHDIYIASNSNTSRESYSNLGRSFFFTSFNTGTVSAQSFLAGARNFQTLEIEVFTCKNFNVQN